MGAFSLLAVLMTALVTANAQNYVGQIADICDSQPPRTLSCNGAGNVLFVTNAVWSRRDQSKCPGPGGDCPGQDATVNVQAKCNGLSTCTVAATDGAIVSSDGAGGWIPNDPCSGIEKYLEVLYYCAPASNIARACDGATTTISCPDPEVINVVAASYGRPNEETCPPPFSPKAYGGPGCLTTDVTRQALDACDQKVSCAFGPGTPGGLPDNCNGVSKYVEVVYVCGAPQNPALACQATGLINGTAYENYNCTTPNNTLVKRYNDGSVSCGEYCTYFAQPGTNVTYGTPLDALAGCVGALDTSNGNILMCGAVPGAATPPREVICFCTDWPSGALAVPPTTGVCSQTCNPLNLPPIPKRPTVDPMAGLSSIGLMIVSMVAPELFGIFGAGEEVAEAGLEAEVVSNIGLNPLLTPPSLVTAEGEPALALTFDAVSQIDYSAVAYKRNAVVEGEDDFLGIDVALSNYDDVEAEWNELKAAGQVGMTPFDWTQKAMLSNGYVPPDDDDFVPLFKPSASITELMRGRRRLQQQQQQQQPEAHASMRLGDGDSRGRVNARRRAGRRLVDDPPPDYQSAWLHYQLDKDLNTETDYLTCKLSTLVSNTIYPALQQLTQQQLNDFNAEVSTVQDYLADRCGDWNCLNFTNLAPGKRNAAAHSTCMSGGFKPNAPGCNGTTWDPTNPDWTPPGCQYTDIASGQVLAGICDPTEPSEFNCFSTSITPASIIAEVAQKTSYFDGENSAANFYVLEQYSTPDAISAYAKGTFLKLALLQQRALLGETGLNATYRSFAGRAANALVAFRARLLDPQQHAGLVDKLSWSTGLPAYADPDKGNCLCVDELPCPRDDTCGGVTVARVTEAVTSPATNAPVQVPTGQLVIGWGCAQGQYMPQSLQCSAQTLNPQSICKADGESDYEPIGTCDVAGLRVNDAAACTASIRTLTQRNGGPTASADLATLDANVTAGTLNAYAALRGRALDALSVRIRNQLYYLESVVTTLTNLSQSGIPAWMQGQFNPNQRGGYYPLAQCALPVVNASLEAPPPLTCPQGTTQERLRLQGGRSPVFCPAGKYQDATSGCCAPCPPGAFKGRAGNVHACVTCAGAGVTTPGPGATRAEQCSLCGVGFYQASASGAPLVCAACPVGTSTPAAGAVNASACSVCAPGHWSPIAGIVSATTRLRDIWPGGGGGGKVLKELLQCFPCPRGFFCAPDAAAPGGVRKQACPLGTETDGTGSASAAACVPRKRPQLPPALGCLFGRGDGCSRDRTGRRR